MKNLLPHHVANYEVKYAFQEAYIKWLEGDDDALMPIANKLDNDPLINTEVWLQILDNIQLLYDPYASLDFTAKEEDTNVE